MKERPILFSAPMGRAIIEGRKTQTRRVVKPQGCMQPECWDNCHVQWSTKGHSGPAWYASDIGYEDEGSTAINCPYGAPGDRLWVRERHAYTTDDMANFVIVYSDDTEARCLLATDGGEGDMCGVGKRCDRSRCGAIARWRPSIHMPRWASRLTLEIDSVRVERLRDISNDDAIAEGMLCGCNMGFSGVGWDNTPIECSRCSGCFGWRDLFGVTWDEINGDCAWASNPWVWVVEFRKVSQ